MGGFKVDISEHAIDERDRINIAIGMALHEELPQFRVEVQEFAIVMSVAGRRTDMVAIVMTYDDIVTARMQANDLYDTWKGYISNPDCVVDMAKYIRGEIERLALLYP